MQQIFNDYLQHTTFAVVTIAHARVYAVTSSPFAEEPDCDYQPR